MRHWIAFFISVSISTVAVASAASQTKIAGAVVENMPSADVVKFVLSPAKESYEHKIICGNDSIRVRFSQIGLNSSEIKGLPLPKGSTLRRARIVPQLQNKSVLQIHPRGGILDACARTSVMTIDGNLVVSMALTTAQKRRRNKLMGMAAKAKETAEVEPQKESLATSDVAAKADSQQTNQATATEATPPPEKNKSKKKKLAGTLFDKTAGRNSALQSDEEVNSQTMKYAGGMMFAALLGFVAWYLKKKKKAHDEIEDNIDILSSKKVSTHQQLMVARVNGAKFLLAVGDKSVTSLGLIPADEDDNASANLSMRINSAVKESLAREPKISKTPYSEIEDTTPVETAKAIPRESFGADFKNAIEKIAHDRDKPARQPRRNAAPTVQRDVTSVQGDVPSNVAGLLSMARMRASLENRSAQNADEFRA